MTEFALILVSSILVNNFVLVQFLGLCPFMGVSKKIETAIGLSLATTFVLTLAAMCSYLVQQYVLKPLDIEFLRTISFILVTAVVVQFTEMVVNKTSPLLYRVDIQRQHFTDVVAHALGRRGRERAHHGPPGQLREKLGNGQIARAEILSPLGNTVSLINHKHGNRI